MDKPDNDFNTPFKKLKGLKVEKQKKDPSTKTDRKQHVSSDETSLFVRAMDGVKPMDSDRIIPEPPKTETVIHSIQENIRRQDKEVMDTLEALTSGRSHFDITCTGEYLEGHIIPMDPTTLRKLKAGEFTTQALLDLHGHTKEEARVALTSFVSNAHAMGSRALLVIHGRGLKSSDGPVLKELVVRWLTTGSLSPLVLAFCSARPCDGGTGALYVLLKRKPKKARWKRPL